jgi:uncharacterized protein YndB with AHSA1/START domain
MRVREKRMSTETVRVVRRFQASAERVFDSWLDPARARRFLFATPEGAMQTVEIDAKAGFRIVERRAEKDFAHVGRYLVVERPRVLSFAFAAGLDGEPLSTETTVRVEIMPLASGCELTLTHEGVPSEYAERNETGWAATLAALDHNLRPDT